MSARRSGTGPDTSLARLIDAYDRELVAAGRAPSTLAGIRRGLRRFEAFVTARGWRTAIDIRPQDVEDFWVYMTTAWQPAQTRRYPRPQGTLRKTALTTRGAVRGFCQWLVRMDHLLLDPTAVLDPVRVARPLPRVLSRAEVDSLLQSVTGDAPAALRDRAILELLYSSGLRAGELVALDVVDLELSTGQLTVRRGKGGTSRRVPVGGPAVQALREYLANGRPFFIRRDSTLHLAALFFSDSGKRLSSGLLNHLFRRRVRAAGLAGRVTPHTLRHTAAVHLLLGGASVRHVQELLGHVCLHTTAHYTRLSIDDLKAALASSHPRARLEEKD